jgi:hypothetical protein
VLSQAEIDAFAADGYVAVRGAVPADVLRPCQDEIWSALGEHGVRRDDPSTWREPVVRIPCPETEAFAAAGSQPVLWEAFDQLIGDGRWWRRRGVGGSIPVRFPSQADPGDAGWHIEGSFEVVGDWWVNYRSRARGLLALYLFSDVDAASAPTRSGLAHTGTPPASWHPPLTKGCRSRRRRGWPRGPARPGRRSWPPVRPGTSSCAIRSWSTPRPGRTRDGTPGSWRSPAWPCTTRSRWFRP